MLNEFWMSKLLQLSVQTPNCAILPLLPRPTMLILFVS